MADNLYIIKVMTTLYSKKSDEKIEGKTIPRIYIERKQGMIAVVVAVLLKTDCEAVDHR